MRYSDRQLLDRVSRVDGFRGIPESYWLLGVRSMSDKADSFDDKFYLYRGESHVMTLSGTTNPGVWSLRHFRDYGADGSAVVKADEWYYGLWKKGKHKGRMRALVQVGNVKYYRDSDKDDRSEEVGKLHEGIIGINFHSVSYEVMNRVLGSIGQWSAGCQVANNVLEYHKALDFLERNNGGIVDYCLLNEF